MLYKVQYQSDEQRKQLLDEYKDKHLIEEQNLFIGNFLIFSDDPIDEKIIYTQVPAEEFEELKQENKILKAQNNATSERADFIEDVVAEIAMQVYQ